MNLDFLLPELEQGIWHWVLNARRQSESRERISNKFGIKLSKSSSIRSGAKAACFLTTTETGSRFVGGLIAALVFGFSANAHAQSPLTIKPSPSSSVGVNNINPAYPLGEIWGQVFILDILNAVS